MRSCAMLPLFNGLRQNVLAKYAIASPYLFHLTHAMHINDQTRIAYLNEAETIKVISMSRSIYVERCH